MVALRAAALMHCLLYPRVTRGSLMEYTTAGIIIRGVGYNVCVHNAV